MHEIIGGLGIAAAGIALVLGVPVLALKIAGVPIPNEAIAATLGPLALYTLGLITIANTYKQPGQPRK